MIKFFTSVRIVFITMAFVFVASINVSYAVQADPKPETVTQPDGSQITIRAHGDEFFNYTTTLDGYIVAKNDKGIYCYADYNSGQLRVSTVQAGKGFYFGGTKDIPPAVQNRIKESNKERLAGTKTMRINALNTNFKPLKVVVILVEYPDTRFVVNNPKQAFKNLISQVGYSENGAIGSIFDYYKDNSMEAYMPEFDVYGPYMMPNDVETYVLNSKWKDHAVDACNAADHEVDFSQYSNGTSDVEAVLIYYAGHNPAERGVGVWPHQSSIEIRDLILDGKRVTNYACSSELRGASGANMAGIGTMTHEFGHILGLRDLYSVDNENNTLAKSWASFNLMNGGSYNNIGRTPPSLSAPQRYKLGWLTLEDIDVSEAYTLEPLHASNKAYRVKTDVDGEYYTFENRGAGKWDADIGGKGMLIYHMDYSNNRFQFSQNGVGYQVTAANMWLDNTPNSAPNHQCSDLVEATGYEGSVQTLPNLFFPGGLNVTSFGRDTKPGFAAWSTADLGVELTNITLTGDNISFKADVAGINHNQAQIRGVVRTVIGLPLKNVEVYVYEAAPQRQTTSGQFYSVSAPERASSTPIFNTKTDDMGRFFVTNIEAEKNYLLEFKTSGYNDLKETRKLTAGQNTMTVNVTMSEDNPDLDVMKWSLSSGTNAYGVADGNIYAAIKFNPVEVKTFKHDHIRSVSVMTDNKATEAVLTIKVGATNSGSDENGGVELVSNMKMEQPDGGLYVFDLSSLDISKDNKKTLTIIIKTVGAVYLDESVLSVANKGDRISKNGTSWNRVSEIIMGADGNWMISVQTGEKIIQTAPYPAIAIAANGYNVGSKFMPEMLNLSGDVVESVKYSVNGTTVSSGGYTFVSSGSYTIVAEIQYTAESGLGTETITRKINIMS